MVHVNLDSDELAALEEHYHLKLMGLNGDVNCRVPAVQAFRIIHG